MRSDNNNPNRYVHRSLITSNGGNDGWQNGHYNGYETNPPPASGHDEAGMNFDALWKAIWQGRWWILLVTVLTVAGVVAYTLHMEPVYEAKSIVSVKSRSEVGGGGDNTTILMTDSKSLPSEVGVLRNSAVLARRVVKRLRKASKALGTDKHYPLLQGSETSLSRQARALIEQVSFEARQSQNMIVIGAKSTSPQEAASIANFYAEEYKAFDREQSRERLAAGRKFLQNQVDKRENNLNELEQKWKSFAQDKQVAQEGEGGERLIATYSKLKAQRSQAKFAMQEAQSTLNMLQNQLEQVEPGLEKQVLNEHKASGLQSEIKALDQKLGTLKARAEEYYAVDSTRRRRPTDIEELENIKNQIAHFKNRKKKLTAKLVGEVKDSSTPTAGDSNGQRGSLSYINRLRSRIAETELTIRSKKEQIRALNQRLGTYDSRLDQLPQQKLKREQLKRKIALAEQWYNSFVQRLQKAQVAEESELGNVRVVRKAVVPGLPVSPNMQRNVVLALLLGLGLGMGVALLRNATDQRLNKPEDVDAEGQHLIGVVPDMNKAIESSFGGEESVEVEGQPMSTSLMTVLDPWSPVAENFRLIRTNVQSPQDAGKPVHTLLVTSPERGDGKSVTAANLAVAIAQGGRRTLLIDADLRRPAAHSLFGGPLSPGLADLLTEEYEFNPDNHETKVEGLSFLPAGELDRPPTELLGSDVMKHQVLSSLREHYDAIIVDSPPVQAATDALVLAPQCDAAVMVVSAHKTDRTTMHATNRKLESVGTRLLGTIINRINREENGHGQYGYYQRYAGKKS